MGGKTVMTNALLHGERVDKLVVVDAAPSLSKSMGEVKVYLDYMLHMDMTAFTSRKQIDEQLKNVAKVIVIIISHVSYLCSVPNC